MVEYAALMLAGSRTVVDLFCGSGNFAVPLSTCVGSITAVDADALLIEAGRTAASSNGCTNLSFVHADAAEFMGQASSLPGVLDAVVLDPPRTGARQVVEWMAPSRVGRVVYVSCNPATLARDVSLLVRKGFRVSSSRLFDMFPHTYHIESVTVLES
jgi:23S rRNA (uracil1939-C5)-methyltransferase